MKKIKTQILKSVKVKIVRDYIGEYRLSAYYIYIIKWSEPYAKFSFEGIA